MFAILFILLCLFLLAVGLARAFPAASCKQVAAAVGILVVLSVTVANPHDALGLPGIANSIAVIVQGR